MTQFTVPTREEVSTKNQGIFDNLEKTLGFVPNLYATIAHSDNALGSYLALSQAQGKGSLSAKEREAISLVVSQVNSCNYCQSAHTAIAKMNGFDEKETIEFRKGYSENAKLDVLVKLAKEVVSFRGNPTEETLENFFAAGYDKGALIDVVLVVIDTTFTNYINNITGTPIDFPLAVDLSQEAVV